MSRSGALTKKCDTPSPKSPEVTLLDLFQIIIMIWEANAISLKSLGITNYTRRSMFQFEMILFSMFCLQFYVGLLHTHSRIYDIRTTTLSAAVLIYRVAKSVRDYNDSDFSLAPHKIKALNAIYERASEYMCDKSIELVISLLFYFFIHQISEAEQKQINKIGQFTVFHLRFGKCFSHILCVEKRQNEKRFRIVNV